MNSEQKNKITEEKKIFRRVKFISVHEDGEIPKGWHLINEAECYDGEYTACGMATPEYKTMEEKRTNGGITCKNCLTVIKFYKNIKL